MRSLLVLIFTLGVAWWSHAAGAPTQPSGALEFASVFNDGAVLQTGLPVNIWGRARPRTTVKVTFAGQEKSALTDKEGRWMLQLDPLEPSTEPRILTATGAGSTKNIADVVVGEVWIASGQSNMVYPLAHSEGGAANLAKNMPLIRSVIVPRQSGLPPRPFTSAQLAWRSFAPEKNRKVAAVAFHFAEYLQTETGGVVGVIQSSVGGTPAEAWTPLTALQNRPELRPHAETITQALASGRSADEWRRAVENYNKFRVALKRWNRTREGPRPEPVPEPDSGNPWADGSPTVLYENMVAPLIPYTVRGVIWYQGESNAFRADEYRILFPSLIGAWRQAWKRPDLPFLFVQLAAFKDPRPGRDFPALRAAQSFTRDTVPDTGMAVTIDAGEPNNIHPRFKKPVGERLARLALAQVYGRDVAARGPLLTKAQNQNGKVILSFEHTGKGLKTADGKPEVPGFAVAGTNKKFHPAAARITGPSTVELTCAEVQGPTAVRYAWSGWIEPPVTLQNSDELPAEPGQVNLEKTAQP